jgi:tetratricopeptide (TPR) repeat protein
MRSPLLLLAFFVCALPLRGADLDAGNRLYDQGKFAEAKAAYEQLLSAGEASANLFYNLGNAQHRLGMPGRAILDYKRALVLDPGHPEARANLDFLRSQTGAAPWPESWIDRLLPASWEDAAVVLGVVGAWVAIFLVAGLILSPRRDNAGAWFGVVMSMLVVAYAGAVIWRAEQGRATAIVTAKTAVVHLAPAESSTSGSTLPAGSEVRVLSERGDWVYCALPGKGRGWIAAKTLERLRPAAS